MILAALSSANSLILGICLRLAWAALGLMTIVILIQVFFRYALNNALPWPDEAARFLMLWMTGLAAPSAYRAGGFVAIDMLPRALPERIGSLAALALLLLSGAVLAACAVQGFAHTGGFGGRFESSSLRVPLSLVGGEDIKMRLAFMYASLLTGVCLLILVNIELVIRAAATLWNPRAKLPEIKAQETPGAE